MVAAGENIRKRVERINEITSSAIIVGKYTRAYVHVRVKLFDHKAASQINDLSAIYLKFIIVPTEVCKRLALLRRFNSERVIGCNVIDANDFAQIRCFSTSVSAVHPVMSGIAFERDRMAALT